MRTTSTKTQERIINLNHIDQNIISKDAFLRDDKIKFIKKKIKDRLKNLKDHNKNKDEFRSLKGHDTILIDGKRGSGKTTLLHSINNKKSKDYHVFKILDPTLIHLSTDTKKTNTDILLMILAKIKKYVENISETCDAQNIGDIHNEIKALNQVIIEGYDVTNDMSYDDRLDSFYSALALDKKFHDLFKKVCMLANKKLLIFPIDDIDMETHIAFKIFEVIRRYMTSPRVIAIVALNSSQGYTIVKKNYFDRFNLAANTNIYDIHSDSDLGFLSSLPRSYMLKLFPPSRRIETDDMLDIFTYYERLQSCDSIQTSKCEKACELIFIYKNKHGIKFKLPAMELLTSFIDVVYSHRVKSSAEWKADNFINYLENLSMRSFMSDMRNFLESISKDTDTYLITKKSIKDNLVLRFLDYPKKHNRKESVLIDVWERFIENATFKNKEGYDGDIILKTLKINGYDSYDRYIKTYRQLWMQSYFLDEIKVDITINSDKEVITLTQNKLLNINGLYDLAIRSFIPMHVTRRQVMEPTNNEKNMMTDANIMFLKSFATRPLVNLLDGITGLERRILREGSKKGRYLGCINYLRPPTIDIDIDIDIIVYDWVPTKSGRIQMGSMSFFKSLIFLMELIPYLHTQSISKGSPKDDEDSNIYKITSLLQSYLPTGFDHNSNKDSIKELAKKFTGVSHRLREGKLRGFSTSFGILALNNFSKRVVKNFSYLHNDIHATLNKNIEDQEIHLNCSPNDAKKSKELEEAYKVITKTLYDNRYKYFALYISAYLNALLIEYISSLECDIALIQNNINIDNIENFNKNFLYLNLKIIETRFNTDFEIDQQTKNAIFDMVIYIIRVLRYYHIWKVVFQEAYDDYGNIYIAKKGNIVEEYTKFEIFFCNKKDAISLDKYILETKEKNYSQDPMSPDTLFELDKWFNDKYKGRSEYKHASQ